MNKTQTSTQLPTKSYCSRFPTLRNQLHAAWIAPQIHTAYLNIRKPKHAHDFITTLSFRCKQIHFNYSIRVSDAAQVGRKSFSFFHTKKLNEQLTQLGVSVSGAF